MIAFAISKDDRYVFNVQEDGTIKVFSLPALEFIHHFGIEQEKPIQEDVDPNEVAQILKSQSIPLVTNIAISPDNQSIYLSTKEKSIIKLSFEYEMNFKSKMTIQEIVPDTKGKIKNKKLPFY